MNTREIVRKAVRKGFIKHMGEMCSDDYVSLADLFYSNMEAVGVIKNPEVSELMESMVKENAWDSLYILMCWLISPEQSPFNKAGEDK